MSMTPIEMCCLIMRNASVRMEDEYNCLHNDVPTDPKTLLDQLTKIETKINSVRGPDKVKADDRRKTGSSDLSWSAKKRAVKAEAGRMKGGDPIPRKQLEKSGKDCALCKEYGGFAKTHKTAACKKWVAGGKPHPEWRGPRASNTNTHASVDMKEFMAEHTKSMEKMQYKIAKLSEKKKKKSSKRSRSRYSDSDSSDLD